MTICEKDWQAFEDSLIYSLSSKHKLLQKISHYVINAGGKRLRPRLIFYCADLCEYTGENLTILAKILEYIHTASLIHDDVIDSGQTRRTNLCAHHVWGNSQAILAGNFLLTRSFSLLIDINNTQIMKLLQRTTEQLLDGQIEEPQITYQSWYSSYLSMIKKKTAVFFAASCLGPGILAQISKDFCKTLYCYGLLLGMSYQLMDDVLELEQPVNTWVTGHDFIENKITFPLLLAYNEGPPYLKAMINRQVDYPFDQIQQELAPYLKQTRLCAWRYQEKAKKLLLSKWPVKRVEPLLQFQRSLFADFFKQNAVD